MPYFAYTKYKTFSFTGLGVTEQPRYAKVIKKLYMNLHFHYCTIAFAHFGLLQNTAYIYVHCALCMSISIYV